MKRFEIQPLAEGVYAVLEIPGSGCGANAGIIDLGDRTLLFDTFQTPSAAAELRRTAEELTGRPVSLVVNSHFHADHLFGNQLFQGVPIFATREIREAHAERAPVTLQAYRERGPAYLAQQEERLAAMPEGRERSDFAAEVASTRHLVAEAPETEAVLPDILFEGRLTVSGSRRTVELLALKGHTVSDVICWLPGERLCFTGDLVLVANHLWMGHGNPADWFENLDRMEALGVERLVPGHGPVGGAEWIGEVREYMKAILARAEAEAARGTTPEEAAKIAPPAPYDQWTFPTGYAWNMRALVEQLRKEQG